MLIQDLKFFEIIDNLDDIQGGSSSSASSVKPGAKAKASADGGDLNYAKTSTTGIDGSATSAVALDLGELEILELVTLFPDLEAAAIDLYLI